MFRAALSIIPGAVPHAVPRHFATASCRSSKAGIGIVGAPFNRGQRREGVSRGPQVIRETGVLDHLSSLGLDVRDYGDVKDANPSPDLQLGPAGERHHAAVLGYNRRLSATVAQVVKEGRVCVTLGGDHSVAIGSIHGHAAAKPNNQVVVLWVDAHADLNTGAVSPTGNMHGMPVAHHLHALDKHLNKLPDGWPQPCLDAHHLVYVGLRDVDPEESALMQRMGVLSFGAQDIDRQGLQGVLAASLSFLQPSPCRPLHLSLDIDALDPVEAPSTGTPVRGGLTMRECLSICEAVHATGHLGAMDLVEVNPSIGTEHDVIRTVSAARLILLSALAARRTS